MFIIQEGYWVKTLPIGVYWSYYELSIDTSQTIDDYSVSFPSSSKWYRSDLTLVHLPFAADNSLYLAQ